jgi:phosphoesterase RecJ-like protein
MLERTVDDIKIENLKQMLADCADCVVLTHSRPDGDAMGSSLALSLFLKACGKKATVVVPNEYPPFLAWMPSIADVVIYDKNVAAAEQVLTNADLFFCLDFNSLSRID